MLQIYLAKALLDGYQNKYTLYLPTYYSRPPYDQLDPRSAAALECWKHTLSHAAGECVCAVTLAFGMMYNHKVMAVRSLSSAVYVVANSRSGVTEKYIRSSLAFIVKCRDWNSQRSKIIMKIQTTAWTTVHHAPSH